MHVAFECMSLVTLPYSHTCSSALSLPEQCMKTQALEGRSAASWRNLPHIQMVPVQLREVGTAGLWSLQTKTRDSRYSDSEMLRFEGPYRHPRTDHMATSHRSCLKAMVSILFCCLLL